MRLAFAFLTLFFSGIAFATARNCAAVLTRAGSDWLLARFSSRLNPVHAYGRPEGAVVLVHDSVASGAALHLYEYRLGDRDRDEALVLRTPWRRDLFPPNMYRPAAVSPDGLASARIAGGVGFHVLLEKHGSSEEESVPFYFFLDPRDRALRSSGPSHPRITPPHPKPALPERSPLNLRFSPDGKKLLGYNALGLEVHDVAAATRDFAVRSERFSYFERHGATRFAGWIDRGHLVEISEEGRVRTIDAQGDALERGELPLVGGRDISATVTWLDGTPLIVAHSNWRPLVFQARDPRTLDRVHSFHVTNLPEGAQLESIHLVPEGFAVFQMNAGGRTRLAAVNFPAAFRHGVESLPWQEPHRREF
jgi:hypothetical protein